MSRFHMNVRLVVTNHGSALIAHHGTVALVEASMFTHKSG